MKFRLPRTLFSAICQAKTVFWAIDPCTVCYCVVNTTEHSGHWKGNMVGVTFNRILKARFILELWMIINNYWMRLSIIWKENSVGAARKVSPNWSQETMTCHSFNCFSIVWVQGNAPLVDSLPSSCYINMTLWRILEIEKGVEVIVDSAC